jgi:phage-related protein
VKTIDNFKIVTKSGVEYDMAAYFGVLVRSFNISSPAPEIQTDKGDNTDGQIRLGKTWGPRRLTATCSFFPTDIEDLALYRNELYRTLMSREQFYLIADAEPGKRWLVEVAGEWTPEKLGYYGEFTLEFISHSPYSESVGTSLTSMDFEQDGAWQIGQGLIETDDLKYTHTTTTFSIYNPGDVTVNPRNMPLVISYKGASTNLEIRNLTTLETWKYTGATASSLETLAINGTRSLKNGVVNIFGDTNRRLITLAPGWNSFDIGGTSGSFEVKFDFRFYYL